MSQSPEHTEDGQEQDNYFSAFNELARRIRDGASFSGRERHCAFLNTGDGSFADVSAVSGFNLPSDGRGMALTDWDHDGDLDVWLSNRSAPRLQFLQNSIPASGARWVSFRLQGDPSKQCPRDAIGSQVEVVLAGSSGRRVKTLHAGNGLMSQSSKWLHFGLGPDAQIESVRVRWSGPGDVREVFNAVQPGQRWHLRQGSGSAQAAEVRPKVHLAPTPMELPTPTELARIRLSQPLQIPKLIYEDFTGARQDLAEISKERAILVNLWATWCVPCAGELKAFANAKSRFAAEGMEVIALNVDHLNPDTKVTPAQAAAMLRNYGFSMRGGMANPELVALLEQSILKSVYRHREMPVPISFLIDRGGWLSAIYKGPVDVEQVIADRKKLGLSPESAKAAAVPFAGTWSQHHFPANPIAIAAAYLEGSYLEDARAELTKFLLENSAPPGNPAVPAAKKLNRQLGDIHLQLAEIALLEERPLEAKVSFQKSLTYNPRQIPALNKLAWLLATSTEDMVRDGAEALKHASFMMQAPGMAENPSLLGTLAAAHAAAGNFQEATRTTDRLIAILDGNGMTEQAKTHRLRRKRFQAGEALSR